MSILKYTAPCMIGFNCPCPFEMPEKFPSRHWKLYIREKFTGWTILKMLYQLSATQISLFRVNFLKNDHFTWSLRIAQDTIEVLKVLFPKKAFINGKSSQYKNRSLKIFEEELFCCPLDRNFAVLIEISNSDQSVGSVRVTRVTNDVPEAVYLESHCCNVSDKNSR